MADKKRIEDATELTLDFNKLQRVFDQGDNQVVPVAIQETTTKDVIMVAFMNKEAFEKTLETKKVIFWSTSRNELWFKGKTSGNTMTVEKIFVNCEQNSLLITVQLDKGAACHTVVNQHIQADPSKIDNHKHRRTCYYRELQDSAGKLSIID